MKNIYCPKCGGVVPGLEEFQFKRYDVVYTKCVEEVKAYRVKHQVSLEETPVKELYKPAIDKYEQLTGFQGTEAFHLWRKHRVSDFPLFCKSCNLCYRAPKTGKCPSCGEINNA